MNRMTFILWFEVSSERRTRRPPIDTAGALSCRFLLRGRRAGSGRVIAAPPPSAVGQLVGQLAMQVLRSATQAFSVGSWASGFGAAALRLGSCRHDTYAALHRLRQSVPRRGPMASSVGSDGAV